MSRLRWSARALRDLEEIADFIAADDPVAARRWAERLRTRAQQAARSPRAGRVVPETARVDIREVFVKTYRIVYRVGAREVTILTVLEGHRLLRGLDPDAV